MYATIKFDFGESVIPIVVDLLDNPGVRIWAEHCTKIDKKRQVMPQPIPGGTTIDAQGWQQLYQKVKTIHDNLLDTKTPMPMWVNTADEITQHHLNVWHRWFTDNTKVIDQDQSLWDLTKEYHWLHELNQIVHIMEVYLVNEWPKTEFEKDYGKELNLLPGLDSHGLPEVSSPEIYQHRQYHSFDHYDLILDQAVHGKTLMQSFIDNDDPNHWDTTGHHITHGGSKLVINSSRSKIYQSAAFEKWASRNHLDLSNAYADYPLGQIRHRDQAVLDNLWHLIHRKRLEPAVSLEVKLD